MKIKNRKIYSVNPDCTLEELNQLAEINNNRVEGGEECTICIGHTQDSDPDTLSIPVGNASNFWVEGSDLFADFDIDDEWEDHIKKYHYNKVSIEKWVDGVIHPICLLARNRPALELGLTKYQMPDRENENGKLSHQTLYYEEVEVENMSPQEIEQLFTETMQHSEFYGKFCDLMENIIPQMQESVKHMEDTLAPLLQEEAEEPEHADIAPELEGEAAELEGEKVEETEKVEEKVEEKPEMVEEKADEIGTPEEKPEVEKNDMTGGGFAAASANNTYVPDLGDKKKKKDEDDMVKHYQKELLKVEQEKAELVQKYQKETRKNELNDLAKTYFFDPSNEIEIVCSMDEEQWDMHKKIIATRYQKTPTNRVVSVVTDVEDRNVKTPDKVQAAIKYACENKVDFKTALDRV